MSENRKRELRLRSRGIEKRYRRGLKFGPISIGFLSLLFFVALSIFYLTQTNRIATKGYEQADLGKQEEELNQEKEALEVEAARLQSIGQIKEGIKDKSMVQNKEASYIVPARGAVAEK